MPHFQFSIQTLSLNNDLDVIWYILPKSYATKVTLTTNNYLCSMKLLPVGNEAHTMAIWVLKFSNGGYRIRKIFA